MKERNGRETSGGDRQIDQLSDELRTELARRDAELDENPKLAMTWRQIRDSVEKKP
ncbi:MAG TPA: hypothetical protein VG097_13635 [Gemmata sp.]|jgi:hypothetical protein|nr:hypothetical protein [Gemmata sp.]